MREARALFPRACCARIPATRRRISTSGYTLDKRGQYEKAVDGVPRSDPPESQDRPRLVRPGAVRMPRSASTRRRPRRCTGGHAAADESPRLVPARHGATTRCTTREGQGGGHAPAALRSAHDAPADPSTPGAATWPIWSRISWSDRPVRTSKNKARRSGPCSESAARAYLRFADHAYRPSGAGSARARPAPAPPSTAARSAG